MLLIKLRVFNKGGFLEYSERGILVSLTNGVYVGS